MGGGALGIPIIAVFFNFSTKESYRLIFSIIFGG